MLLDTLEEMAVPINPPVASNPLTSSVL